MEASIAEAQCKNCDAALGPAMRYCPHCGQRATTPRLSLHEISHELMHAFFHVDRSVLALLRALLTRPGGVASDYVLGKRKRYFGPFALLVIVVALASAAIHFSYPRTLVLMPQAPDDIVAYLQELLIKHANLMFFLQVPLLAAACRVLGIGGRFNYAEYLVLAAYTSSARILFFTLAVIPIKRLAGESTSLVVDLYIVYLTLWALYFGLAMAQFQVERRVVSALKGIVAVVVAQMLGSILLSALAQAVLQFRGH